MPTLKRRKNSNSLTVIQGTRKRTKPNISGKKEIIKIKAETNEIENRDEMESKQQN